MQKHFKPSAITSCQCFNLNRFYIQPEQKIQQKTWFLKPNVKLESVPIKKKSLKETLGNKRSQQLQIKISASKNANLQLETQKIPPITKLKKSNYSFQSVAVQQNLRPNFIKYQSQQYQRKQSSNKPKITFNLYGLTAQALNNKNTYFNGEKRKNIDKFDIDVAKEDIFIIKKSQIDMPHEKNSQFIQVKHNESNNLIFQNKELLQVVPTLHRVKTLDPKLIQSQRDSNEQSQQISQVLMYYCPSANLQNPQINEESPLKFQGFQENEKMLNKFLND